MVGGVALDTAETAGRYRKLLGMMAPIALNSVLFSCLGFVDSVMLSRLGADAVAAAGVGAKVMWLVSNIAVGIGSAVSIYCSQFWGARDKDGFSTYVHVGLVISAAALLVYLPLLWFFSPQIAGLATPRDDIARVGADYLRVTTIALGAGAITIVWDSALRSMQKPGVVLKCFMFELAVNIALNYLFVFGAWGFPKLGAVGAAWGTATARVVRAIVVWSYILLKEPSLRLRWAKLMSPAVTGSVLQFVRMAAPICGGMLLWTGGVFTYQIILGNLDGDALAVISLVSPIELIFLSVGWGAASATGIVVGNAIGAGDLVDARRWAMQGFRLAAAVGIGLSGMLLMLRAPLLLLFGRMDAAVLDSVASLFPFLMGNLFLRSLTMTLMAGVLRAGGDTRYCFMLDTIGQWAVAIPICYVAAFHLHWPLEYVYGAMLFEELVKLVPGWSRLQNGRWARNVTRADATLSAAGT